MYRHGTNCDPLNPQGRPDPGLLARLGFGSVRVVLRDDPAVYSYAEGCHAVGVEILGALAMESFRWASPEPVHVQAGRMVAAIRPAMVQIGNEPDCRGESSWHAEPMDYVPLARLIAGEIRWRRPEARILAAGLASGHSWWLREALRVGLNEVVDGYAVHPYDKPADKARLLIEEYNALTPGRPWYVTEWNRPAAEIPEFAAMLSEETAGGFWFSWHDFREWRGGLMGLDGQPKAEYYALMEVLRMPEFLYGFKRLAEELGEEVVGDPIEEEHYFPDGKTSLQQTTRGLMIYSKEGNQPLFLPAWPLPNR